MARWYAAALLGLTVAACGSPGPVAVDVTIEAEPCETACTVERRASGVMGITETRGGAARETLFAETTLPDAATVVVELTFSGERLVEARYREVLDGHIRYRGQVVELSGRAPGHDGVSPVAGRFSLVVEDDGARRRVSGLIIPAEGEAVRVDSGGARYVSAPTVVGCSGEIYLPPPETTDPDGDPAWEVPEPAEMPSTPSNPETPSDPWPPMPEDPDLEGAPPDDDPPEPRTPEGNDPADPTYGTEPPPAPVDSGCGGDSYREPAESEPADSGCDGDSYEDDTSSSDTGCGGDDGDDWGGDASSDSGCDGDDYEAAALLPVFGSMWRLSWPLGLAGLFNRRARRRRR